MGKTESVNAAPSKQRVRAERARRPRVGRAIGELGTVGDPHLFEIAGFALCGTNFDPHTHMLYSGWPPSLPVADLCENCTTAYAAAKPRRRGRKPSTPPPPPAEPAPDLAGALRELVVAIALLVAAWFRGAKIAAEGADDARKSFRSGTEVCRDRTPQPNP